MKYLVILVLGVSLTLAQDSAVQKFTNANNLFASDVYTKISKTEASNFLVSPFSAESILALVHSGCRRETAKELRRGLHLPEGRDKIESGVKSLLPKLTGNELYTLQTANKMYVKKDFSIRARFKRRAIGVYSASSEVIDFTKSVEAANTMNQWVEKHTNNKIKKLIDSNDLNDDTRAVLINALYFKANWSNPFLLSHTSKNSFYKTTTDVVQVDTMHHYGQYFNYYECPHLQAQFLELPFKGGEACMVIVLPREKEGLAALEGQIDQIFAPQHELRNEYVSVALSKFKIESTINFKKILSQLGVRKIFNASEADLSGIAGKKGDLIVSEVVQKTFIDLSEEGAEAAAATFFYLSVPGSAYSGPVQIPKQFIADHPFIFYIKVQNLIIFAGKVTDPKY